MSSSVEPFVALAKGTRGAATAAVIAQALSAPDVFFFYELLQVPSVRDLQGTDQQNALALLKIFSYGTWEEYAAARDGLPPLNAAQETKLKQLTVASLAAGAREIPYALLEAKLGLSGVRAVEDLLIGCMYADLVQGKLDQRGAKMLVHSVLGRDPRPGDLVAIRDSIAAWRANTQKLLGDIERNVEAAVHGSVAKKMHREEREKKKTQFNRISAAASGESGLDSTEQSSGGFESREYREEQQRRRGRQ